MASTDALAKMVVTISANTADFAKAMRQTNSQLASLSNAIKQYSSVLGLAFGAREVIGFTVEVAKLAGEAEGVRGAFDRLTNSKKVLSDLKEATGGTVSELELMKAAVQANNFQIPIEQLATLFRFATLRAQQTGQSVDYLVQSIVTGIGRKSPLILDNLGISAVRLREKLKGVGTEAATVGDVAKVVGDIAQEELGSMAGFSENTATKIQKLAAEWANFKVVLGDFVNQSGIVTDSIDAITAALRILARTRAEISNGGNNGPSFLGALGTGFKIATGTKQLELLKDGLVAFDAYQAKMETLEGKVEAFNKKLEKNGAFDKTVEGIIALRALGKAAEDAGKKLIVLSDETSRTRVFIRGWSVTTVEATNENTKLTNTLETLESKLKDLNTQFEQTDVSDRKSLQAIGEKIIALDKQIKKLNELRKESKDQGTGLAALRNKLAEVNKELENTNIEDEKHLNSLRQQKQALEELIAAQERLNKKRNEAIVTQTRLDSAIKNGNFLELSTKDKVTGKSLLPSLFDLTDEQVQKMIAAIRAVKQELKTFGDTSIEIGGVVSGAIVDMANAFGSLTQKSFNFGEAIIQVAAGFAQQFGAILIAAGVAKISFDKFSGPAMIATGAALVALGAAAKGVIANRPNLSNAGSGSGATSNSASISGGVNGGLISIIGDGEWRISGRDLVYIYDKNKGLDGSRRG